VQLTAMAADVYGAACFQFRTSVWFLLTERWSVAVKQPVERRVAGHLCQRLAKVGLAPGLCVSEGCRVSTVNTALLGQR
jgi:hypothetical protein